MQRTHIGANSSWESASAKIDRHLIDSERETGVNIAWGNSVWKFGGGVLRGDTAEQAMTDLRQTIDLIRDGKPRAVVVSAFGGITNALYSLIDNKTTPEEQEQILAEIGNLHQFLLPKSETTRNLTIAGRLETVLHELRAAINIEENDKTSNTNSFSARIVSRGEYLAGLVLAAHLPEYNFFPSECGIACSDFPDKGINYSSQKASKCPPDGSIITGFYGITPDGEIETGTRGASDLIAVIVGDLLNTETVVLFKRGANGVMSGDPKIIEAGKPRTIKELPLNVLMLLSNSGAKIVHRDVWRVALERPDIRLELRSIDAPQKPETTMTFNLYNCPPFVIVNGIKDIQCIDVITSDEAELDTFIRKCSSLQGQDHQHCELIFREILADDRARLTFAVDPVLAKVLVSQKEGFKSGTLRCVETPYSIIEVIGDNRFFNAVAADVANVTSWETVIELYKEHDPRKNEKGFVLRSRPPEIWCPGSPPRSVFDKLVTLTESGIECAFIVNNLFKRYALVLLVPQSSYEEAYRIVHREFVER